MILSIEQILLVVSILLFIGVLASKASYRLGVPALLLFLLMGMLAGSEGPGGIPFDDPLAAQALGIVALAFILFAGGLDTDWKTVAPIAGQALILATLGVFLTAVLLGWFSTVVLGFSWIQGLLLGSIVSSTDAAAVFSVLRSQRIGLKGRTKPLLELESGSNDPMAVFLTVGFIRLLGSEGGSVWELFPTFLLQMGVGAAMGLAVGRGGIWLLNRLKLESDGLYPVVTVALVLFAYGATDALWGNGFLAVYIAGIVLGSGEIIHKRSLVRFHDGVAWLMQIAMFLVLGLLLFPSRLWPVAGVALAVSLFLMFVARPVAVLLCLAFARIRFRQKLFVAWVGLRGAVPIILATFPLVAGIPNAEIYFNIVFFVVLTSVLLQGTTIPLVARWLKLATPLPAKRQYPLEYMPVTKTKSDLIEVSVPDTSPVIGKRIMDLGLPKTALITLVSRGEDFIAPRGGLVLEQGDRMLILADKDDIDQLHALVEPSRAQGAADAKQENRP